MSHEEAVSLCGRRAKVGGASLTKALCTKESSRAAPSTVVEHWIRGAKERRALAGRGDKKLSVEGLHVLDKPQDQGLS